MPSLPSRFAEVILTFAPLFLQQRTWDHAGMLLIGAILAPGQRTVTSLLRIMGLSGERRFVNYHRVLNRAVWSSRATLVHGYANPLTTLRFVKLAESPKVLKMLPY